MSILLDMNMSPRWVGVLRDAGYQARHWSTLGKASDPDRLIMAHAREHGWIVITQDLDFSALLAQTNDHRPSVIQIRVQDARPETIGFQVIAAILATERYQPGCALVTIGPRGSRMRVLPLRPIE